MTFLEIMKLFLFYMPLACVIAFIKALVSFTIWADGMDGK